MTPEPETPLNNGVLLDGDEKATAVRDMFDRIAPRYDRVNRIMSFRLDVRWRRTAVAALGLARKSVVLDLACGTGDLCEDLRREQIHPIGVDFSMGMMKARRTDAQVLQGDVLQLPIPNNAVDGAICGFAMRNFTNLEAFFAELARVTRPRGRIAVVDASSPENRVAKFGHHIYFDKVVPWVGGVLSDKSAYSYLPASLAYLPPTSELMDIVRDAGFSDATRRELTLGAAQLITATKD
ncbi:MAG: ubiquinone/menaquinone biosynthesis methyltransferase [Actinobacteria bacterium]|nr:ubiquinone/menaquinone biosynthesis methyltransferase [Actinomycetota bacterium]